MFKPSFLKIVRLVQKLNWVDIKHGDLKMLPAHFLPRKKIMLKKKVFWFSLCEMRTPTQAVSRVSGLGAQYRSTIHF
jgi:hypothetical protein